MGVGEPVGHLDRLPDCQGLAAFPGLCGRLPQLALKNYSGLVHQGALLWRLGKGVR